MPEEKSVETVSLAEQMRSRIAVKRGDNKALIFKDADADRLQIDKWIPMDNWFRECTGGDLPIGHATIFLGVSNSGKTSCMMLAALNTQKQGGVVYLIDSERKFSFKRFKLMGGKLEELVVLPVDSLEDAWDSIGETIDQIGVFRKESDPDHKVPMLILFDSQAAAMSKKLLELETGKASIGVEARISNEAWRRVKIGISEYSIAFVTVCHYYWSIPKTPFEQPKIIIKGGGESEYQATLILEFFKGAKIIKTVGGVKKRVGVTCRVDAYKCHSEGTTSKVTFQVVDEAIFNTKEEVDEWWKTAKKSERFKSQKPEIELQEDGSE